MSIRRDPFDEMERMFDQMRRSMTRNAGSTGFGVDSPFGRGRGSFGMGMGAMDDDGALTPRGEGRLAPMGGDSNLTMESTDDGFMVLADIPGFEKDEIDLRLDGDSLVISAERDLTEEGEGTVSRRHRSVHERITLPESVLESDVSATYRNGVLEIHLPTDVEMDEDSHRIDID